MHNTEIIKCRKHTGIKVKRMALEEGRSTLVRKCLSPTIKGKGREFTAKRGECHEKETVYSFTVAETWRQPK